MSSFTYLSIAAAAAAAAAAAKGEAVDHIRRLSSSSSEDNPYHEEMERPLPMLGIMFAALVIGFFIVSALLQYCASCDPNDHQQAASCQPSPKRILPLMSIEPALTFTNGLTLAGGADHPECTVCLSEIVEGEEIRILSNCRHGFHLKCIETWLSSRSSCPTCRASCLKTSVKNNPPEQQQQQQQQQNNDVDLEAANPTEIEMSTATTSIE